MPSPKPAPDYQGVIFNMDGKHGDNFDNGYVWIPIEKPIQMGYPITAKELGYQIQVGIWKAGRGPHPDIGQNKKAQEMN